MSGKADAGDSPQEPEQRRETRDLRGAYAKPLEEVRGLAIELDEAYQRFVDAQIDEWKDPREHPLRREQREVWENELRVRVRDLILTMESERGNIRHL